MKIQNVYKQCNFKLDLIQIASFLFNGHVESYREVTMIRVVIERCFLIYHSSYRRRLMRVIERLTVANWSLRSHRYITSSHNIRFFQPQVIDFIFIFLSFANL